MSIIDDAHGAEKPAGADGTYITSGSYLLQATLHKEQTEKSAFIAEHDVLWSQGVENLDPRDKGVINPGNTATLYVDTKKFKGSLAWEMAFYLATLFERDESEFTKENFAAILSPAQPAIGRLIRCTAYIHVTRPPACARITKHKWSPAMPEDYANVGAYRERAGLPPWVAGQMAKSIEDPAPQQQVQPGYQQQPQGYQQPQQQVQPGYQPTPAPQPQPVGYQPQPQQVQPGYVPQQPQQVAPPQQQGLYPVTQQPMQVVAPQPPQPQQVAPQQPQPGYAPVPTADDVPF